MVGVSLLKKSSVQNKIATESFYSTMSQISWKNRTESNSGFDIAVSPCRMFLTFLGTWPDPVKQENVFSIFRFVVAAATMLIFANIAQTTMVLKIWGDLNGVIEILTTANIPIFVALMKFLVAWCNRKVLRELVIAMAEDWQINHTERNHRLMWNNARLSRKLSIVCICLAQGTIIAQFIMVVVFDVNNKGGAIRTMYMISYFPYDTQKSPNYEITWLGQCFSNIFAAGAFSALDSFFAVLVLHLCSQVAILRANLVEIVDGSNKQNFSAKLANIVDRHEHLNRFSKTIEDSFNLMFLAQMIASSVALCLQGYQLVVIITNKGDLPVLQLIHMIYFTCCFSFSLFVYCYVAEELRYESTEMGYAAYKCYWYNLTPQETKLLLLIIHRARKPFEITAGKFCSFSLGLYCSILKTSGGYLSMLLAVKDRLVLETI